MTNPCAITPCTQRVARGHLMCPTHWMLVPKAERVQVNRTWRMFDRAMAMDSADTFAALTAYQEAVEAAAVSVSRTLDQAG